MTRSEDKRTEQTQQMMKCPECGRRAKKIEYSKPKVLRVATYWPCGHEWIMAT